MVNWFVIAIACVILSFIKSRVGNEKYRILGRGQLRGSLSAIVNGNVNRPEVKGVRLKPPRRLPQSKRTGLHSNHTILVK
jgi:hypothetical protein